MRFFFDGDNVQVDEEEYRDESDDVEEAEAVEGTFYQKAENLKKAKPL